MSSCLSSEQIERFVAGDLGTEQAGACAEHIATCEKCGQAVEAHRSSESMLKLLRTEHAAATHSIQSGDRRSVRAGSGVEEMGLSSMRDLLGNFGKRKHD